MSSRSHAYSPADVLNAPFTLLPELHVSLDGLLQVQDRGVLYYNHSCNKGQTREDLTATASDGRRGTPEALSSLVSDRGSSSGRVGLWLPPTPWTWPLAIPLPSPCGSAACMA